MDNLATKPPSWYDGSVNGLSGKKIQHEPYIYSPRSIMIVFPGIHDHNSRAIDHMGWPLSTIITKCQNPTLHVESLS